MLCLCLQYPLTGSRCRVSHRAWPPNRSFFNPCLPPSLPALVVLLSVLPIFVSTETGQNLLFGHNPRTPYPLHIWIIVGSDHTPGLSSQVSLATLDSEALLTLGLNLSHLGRAKRIVELRPALEGLEGRVRYVIARGNEQGFFRMRHLRGFSSLQLGRRRPRPGTYQLEVVSNVAGPWGVQPEGQPGPRGQALRLKVQLQLL
nr:fibrillin-3-like [Macaca nemestrina]